MASKQGLPGGANIAITSSAQGVDLSLFKGYVVELVCNEQDIQFCWTQPTSTSTTLVTGAQAASLTALVAKPIGATVIEEQQVLAQYTRLVVKTVTGSGTLVIKPIRKA